MKMDFTGFKAPQFGLPAVSRRQWYRDQEAAALAKGKAEATKTAPVKTPVVVKAAPARVAVPSQAAKLVAAPPVVKTPPEKTECRCGRCSVCAEEARQYRERLLRK